MNYIMKQKKYRTGFTRIVYDYGTNFSNKNHFQKFKLAQNMSLHQYEKLKTSRGL